MGKLTELTIGLLVKSTMFLAQNLWALQVLHGGLLHENILDVTQWTQLDLFNVDLC